MARIKTRFTGVYKRESTTRRHDGRPDVCFDIAYTDADGKKVWEKVGWASEGYSMATAADIRGQRIQALRHGQELPKRRKRSLTLAEGWEAYSSRCLPELARPEDIQWRWTLYIEPALGTKSMSGITVLDVEDLKTSLLRRGLSPQTVVHILGTLRRIYRKLTEWELYSGRIPTTGVKLPTVDNHRLRYLTPDEARSLLEALKASSLQWYRISLLSLHTGMRLGEVVALRAGDVDLPGRIVNIKDAKTGSRAGYLTDTTVAELATLLPASKDQLLFPARDGGLIADKSKTFVRVVDALGLNADVKDRRDKVVFHTLRHTFGSWAAQRGIPLQVIAELMGHDTITITKRYAKLAPDQKRLAMAQIEEMYHAVSPDP